MLKYRETTAWQLRSLATTVSNANFNHQMRWKCEAFKISAPAGLNVSFSDENVYFAVPCTPSAAVNASIVVGAGTYNSSTDKHSYDTIEEYNGVLDGSKGYYTTQSFLASSKLARYYSYPYDGYLVLDDVSKSLTTYAVIGYTIGTPLTVTDIAVDTTITDGEILLTWSAQAQTAYAVQIENATGTVVYEFEQDNRNSNVMNHTVPARTLGTGTYTVCIQVATYVTNTTFTTFDEFIDTDGYRPGTVSEWAEATIDFSRAHAEVISFEPDSVPQNAEQDISVYWTSTNQHGYALRVLQNGQAVQTFSGATATAVTIPADTLAHGTTELELTLKYIPGWGGEEDAVYTTKKISFDAYGTPPAPVLQLPAQYDTAYPVITWTAAEQYTFRLLILCGETTVLDTGEVQSSSPSYTVTEPLENGGYTVKLIVKNQYGIYSPETSGTTTIAFAAPSKPALRCTADASNGTVLVHITAGADRDNFGYCDLLRREQGGVYIRIATNLPADAVYRDYTVRGGAAHEYLARAIGDKGGFTNSDSVTASVEVPHTQLFDPASPEDMVILSLQPSKTETPTRGVYPMQFAGLSAPRAEYSADRYARVDASFYASADAAARLTRLYYAAPIVCLRDNRGRRLFGFFSSEPVITDDAFGYCKIRLAITEASYSEAV